MAKKIEIRSGDIVLSEAMEILHQRMQNLSKLQYSFCCSPSGCLPSRVAVNSQGGAIGENMFQHFVLSSVAEFFRGGQGLQSSGRCSLLQYSFRCSPSGCLPSLLAVNSQGVAVGENMLRHFVPSGGTIQSLQGSDRYFLLYCCRIAPTDTPFESLQGSDRYFLRHRRRITPADAPSMSLKGSDRYSPAA